MTARWADLLLLTWAVPDALLLPHLPPGVELDRHDGRALASVVAFDFEDIRLFGVGRLRNGRTLLYRVEHPVWRVWPEVRVALDVDFAALYGEPWAFMNVEPPLSTIAAEGSAVRVFPHESGGDAADDSQGRR